MHDQGYVDLRELHCDCGSHLRLGMRFRDSGKPCRLVRLECPKCGRPSGFKYDGENAEVEVKSEG